MAELAVEYVRRNRAAYNREAIHSHLREAGYPDEEIEQAWSIVGSETPLQTKVMSHFWRYWWRFALLSGALAVAVVSVMSPTTMYYSPGAVAIFLGTSMIGGVILAGVVVALTAPRKRGFGFAAATGVLVPLAVVLALSGYCISSFPRP